MKIKNLILIACAALMFAAPTSLFASGDLEEVEPIERIKVTGVSGKLSRREAMIHIQAAMNLIDAANLWVVRVEMESTGGLVTGDDMDPEDPEQQTPWNEEQKLNAEREGRREGEEDASKRDRLSRQDMIKLKFQEAMEEIEMGASPTMVGARLNGYQQGYGHPEVNKTGGGGRHTR
ncbi:MAG: hypothetical protein AB8E15_04445 [Bdellovibrionales bacterium]